jgi:hypothetical protein
LSSLEVRFADKPSPKTLRTQTSKILMGRIRFRIDVRNYDVIPTLTIPNLGAGVAVVFLGDHEKRTVTELLAGLSGARISEGH